MLIVGTGAVACFLAQSLARVGIAFQVFGSPSDRLDALNVRYGPAIGVSRVEEIEPHLQWLVALKTWQNEKKLDLLVQAPRPNSLLLLQNGLWPEKDWSRLHGVQVERGLSTYGVKLSSPGVASGGERGEIVLSSDSCYADLLSQAGFQVRLSSHLELAVWHKLAVNASLNVVASLQGSKNGEVLEEPSCRRLVFRAAAEVSQVAQAAGFEWGPIPAESMVEAVARDTASNVCSTLADLRSGRPTEYDSINGEVLRRAEQLAVPVPVLRFLDDEFRKLGQRTLAPVSVETRGSGMPVYVSSLPSISASQADLAWEDQGMVKH